MCRLFFDFEHILTADASTKTKQQNRLNADQLSK